MFIIIVVIIIHGRSPPFKEYKNPPLYKGRISPRYHPNCHIDHFSPDNGRCRLLLLVVHVQNNAHRCLSITLRRNLLSYRLLSVDQVTMYFSCSSLFIFTEYSILSNDEMQVVFLYFFKSNLKNYLSYSFYSSNIIF